MRKSTFYGLAAFSGVCAMVCAYVARERFFAVGSCHCSRVDMDFLAIGNALKSYQINAGQPPTTAQGLAALVSVPTSGPKPKRWVQIMKKLPRDAWLNPYRYSLLSPKEYEWRWELRSAGPDGVFGSSDDQAIEEESGRMMASIPEAPEAGSNSRPSY
ncbi:type II secretion system protein GspG [Luteolibacter soli]|uniref:Type II secretion system protein GspG n=1 Tax=Luteolibacter soli TaxID=3135280 RepID=A0ABU9AUX3_9BACT